MKEALKSFLRKIWALFKKKCWYIVLLCASTAYVWRYRCDIYQMKEINAQNLIFILWLFLLLFPLFSEMEFLGVKVKKEVEKATEEVKDSVKSLQTQITQLQMTNSIANNISLGSTALPSEQRIEELLQIVRDLQRKASDTNAPLAGSATKIDNENVYLFKVRLDIETSLRELCERIGHTERIPVMRMTQLLSQAEIINKMTCDLISQVIKIANRGVHGEIVSTKYIDFVSETYPEIVRQLKEASSRLQIPSWTEF